MTDESDDTRREAEVALREFKQGIDKALSNISDEAARRAARAAYLRRLHWELDPHCWRFFGRRIGRPPRFPTGMSEQEEEKFWEWFEQYALACVEEERRRREGGLPYRVVAWFSDHPWWPLLLPLGFFLFIILALALSAGGP